MKFSHAFILIKARLNKEFILNITIKAIGLD